MLFGKNLCFKFIIWIMITRADKKDSKRCIELLNLAMEDIAFCLSGTTSRAKSNEILTSFFNQDINRLSYNNIYIYRDNDQILGAVCAYFGGDLKSLDEPIINHLRLKDPSANVEAECFNDEFYIDSIAVDEKFRGRGIAKELIKFIFEIASQRGIKKVSLIVDEEKIKTKEFYEKFGFKENCIKIINSHKYYHMIKEL